MKVCFVGLNGHFERIWLDGGFLAELMNRVDTKAFALGLGIPRSAKHSHLFSILNFDKGKVWKLALDTSVWLCWVLYANLSPSFAFRIKRLVLGDFFWIRKGFSVQHLSFFFRQFKNSLIGILRKPLFVFAALIPFKKRLLSALLTVIGSKSRSIWPIEFEQSDFIIVSCSGNEPELLLLLQIYGEKLLVISENWDHLTSKTYFPRKPAYLIVPSEKYKKWAIETWEIPSAKILVAPPGRWWLMFQTFNRMKFERDTKTKTVAYFGSSIPHDEISTVNQVAEKLYVKILSENVSIEYRAHPTQFRVPSTLDSNIKLSWRHCNNLVQKLPGLSEEYVQSVIDPLVAICAPSSIAVERLFLVGDCIIDGTTDRIHRTSYGACFANWYHWSDLKGKEGAFVARSINSIIEEVNHRIDNGETSREPDMSICAVNTQHPVKLMIDFLSVWYPLEPS